MDPLSISASHIGFLQFAGQLGTMVSKFISADKDAKRAVRGLREEINYLERIIHELQQPIENHGATLENSTKDFSQLQACRNVQSN
ncbi:hypothetical protein M422DRAFT_32361 [Sphaerobolus stellatus SS14]|uniref:Azaphilone pigments biosynthesis cluster protein L N-terminal domain-containing protein n=1 Tax=Sphaerobolus stellatus (strain SS14) TaxID=990650 RepID=A0A0C9UB12_SPHS4|nr:hypothetical protein M422DRAFT_32361 [Sphaerobolus stellatus SS14]